MERERIYSLGRFFGMGGKEETLTPSFVGLED